MLEVKTSKSLDERQETNSGFLLAQGLKEKTRNYKKLIAVVLNWTGGQPFLTQKLCKLIVESEDAPSRGKEADWVEELVRSCWIENWENLPDLELLQKIRDRLCQPNRHGIQLLNLYQQILQQDVIAISDNPQQKELQQLGLIVKKQGKLKVHNLIYESVFNRNWIENALQSIQFELELSDAEFIKEFAELERKLLMCQVDILSKVEDGTEEQGSARSLYEVLRDVTKKVGRLLSADRTTIFLLNEEKTELWSLVAQNEKGEFLDIQVRVGEGLAGQVAKTKKVINIPENVYEDPRSQLVKEYDKKYNYRTENMLVFPILNDNSEVVAVIQLLNKLQPLTMLAGERDREKQHGFTIVDLERLAKCVIPIRRILESCQSCYKATKKLRATAALAEATRSLDKINLDTQEILQRVMMTAKKLMNADRSTLWLVDRDRGDLWTLLPDEGELRCELGVGFAGDVAKTCQPAIVPFDLYNHPNANKAKKTDKQTGYRTCSLLCMPVLSPEGELLGVTQLVNKRKPGNFPEGYNKKDWPNVPDHFKASFDKHDRQSMQIFNQRVGAILQFAKSHERLKQLAQIDPKEAVHKTLAILSNAAVNQSNEALKNSLYYMLTFITQSIGKLLGVDSTTIFLLNRERNEVWSLVRGESGSPPAELKLPANRGIAGKMVYNYRKAIGKLSHLNDQLIQAGLQRSPDYPIYNLLLFPIFDKSGMLVAIIRLFNKVRATCAASAPLLERIEPKGFTREDVYQLQQQIGSILPILQAFQLFYRDIKTIEEQLQEIDPLYQAIDLVNQSSGNAEDIIQNVMRAAKKLTNADRSTLWIVDKQANELWTKLPRSDGDWIEIRVPLGEGFVGTVARTGDPLNIPFDIYNSPGSEIVKQTDRKSGYRTCSLLCLPVLGASGELLGVTQLVNKRRGRDCRNYYQTDGNDRVPDFFKASFDEQDRRDMEVFNNQVGVVLSESGISDWRS